MNKIDNAPLFRRGGHGVINIIRHMNYFKDAVPLRDLVGHGVIVLLFHVNNLNLRYACPCLYGWVWV